MNAIFTLWSAFANLARACNRLASVADSVADEAERRVEVLGHQPVANRLPLPEEPSGNGNGSGEKITAGRRK